MKFFAAIAAVTAYTNQEKLYDALQSQEEYGLVAIPGPAYEPWMSNDAETAEAGQYVRAIKPNFSAGTDDIFMRSVLTTYAQEGAECDEDPVTAGPVNCKPNGTFTLNKSSARALMTEVLGTHAGLTGDAAKSYLDTYFDKAWGHFDVNQTGSIEATKAGTLSRFLLSDQRKQLGESGF